MPLYCGLMSVALNQKRPFHLWNHRWPPARTPRAAPVKKFGSLARSPPRCVGNSTFGGNKANEQALPERQYHPPETGCSTVDG